MDPKEFDLWLEQLGFEPEVRFPGLNGKRRWRFDWCLKRPRQFIAVEYMGLGRGRGKEQERGGHETRSGLARDYEKITEASVWGVTVVLCTYKTIKDGRCQHWVERALINTEGA